MNLDAGRLAVTGTVNAYSLKTPDASLSTARMNPASPPT